jgi:hypothetical protein
LRRRREKEEEGEKSKSRMEVLKRKKKTPIRKERKKGTKKVRRINKHSSKQINDE